MKRRRETLVGSAVVVAALAGCAEKQPSVEAGGEWSAVQAKVITGLYVPECVLPVPGEGVIYISNIVASKGEYWSDDGTGFISLADSDGTMKELRWLASTPEAPVNAPKGMCILAGYLYFTDNSRLMRCSLAKGGPPERVPLPGAEQLNDLATDGVAVYVSDTKAGKAWRIDPAGARTEIPAPANINGLTFHKGKMFAVSWDLHEVYELDPAGKEPPKPFGVASHFKNLDGIEVLDDGTFVVSDFMGNKVSTVAPDRKTVSTLVEIESPADIGVDRGRGLLYVPQFMKKQAAVYALKRE